MKVPLALKSPLNYAKAVIIYIFKSFNKYNNLTSYLGDEFAVVQVVVVLYAAICILFVTQTVIGHKKIY
jgi:hypothetical protein